MKRLPDKTTTGEAYGPAMEMQTQADAYFELLIEWHMRLGNVTREKAEEIQKSNLGYFSGYYDRETMVRVQRLFHCAHPVFGKAEEGISSAEEAFTAGERMGKNA